MALEIGGGITLGGGISLTVESGGGGGGSTYSVNTDYNDGTSGGPAGIELIQSGPTIFLALDSSRWSNPAGFAALYALTTGGTFVVTMPATSATTYTITLAEAWSGSSSSPFTTVTSSPPLNVGTGIPPDDVPTTVSSITI